MIGWKGEHITSLDFLESEKRYGSPFWDFHRADLHNCLYERAVELGAKIHTSSRVIDIEYQADPAQATVILTNGNRYTADLVVGADGIVSRTRECFLKRTDPPTPTGDLAYRVLLDLREIQLDEDVQKMLEQTEVNYWMGPGAHAVCYLLRDRAYLNSEIAKRNQLFFFFLLFSVLTSSVVVLLVPDDIPDGGARTVDGNVLEMRQLFADWDPRRVILLKSLHLSKIYECRLIDVIKTELAKY